MIVAMTLAGGLTVVPDVARTQNLPEAGAAQKKGEGGDGGNYKETTSYDFKGDSVTGNLVKPSNENIQGTTHGKTSSLIDIRSDFIPEMLKSVEDL
jgi:hypothetical protein